MTSKFAVIFDMNGVIIDDMPFHKRAWRDFSQRFQREITEEEYNRELSGRTNSETFRYLLGRDVPAEEVLVLEEQKEELYRSLYADHRKLLPGLEFFLQDLRESDIPMAVATAAPPGNVTFILDELGIRQFFTAVVDASQVRRGKPDPEIFLKAAGKLGVPAGQAVVFEDGLLGMEAARRAGMKVIGVTTTHHRDELQGLDGVVENFLVMNSKKISELFLTEKAAA